MCGAYGLYKEQAFTYWKKRYDIEDIWDHPDFISYNIRPSQKGRVVTRNFLNKGILLNFGIEAPWDNKHQLINAQS